MVAFNIVGRLRHQNDLRAYRHALSSEVSQDLAIRLLPALIEIPPRIVDHDGAARTLSATLHETARVTLAGASGSGRRLALQQLAARWAASEDTTGPIPLLLSLPRLDDGHSPPAALVTAWLQAASQATPQRPARGMLSRIRSSAAPPNANDQLAGWLLLIYGWEELLPERRAAWRTMLLDAPRVWPLLHLAIALPIDEPPWPNFTALEIAPPTPAILTAWVQQLVPGEPRAAILEALAPGGRLQALSERLFEIALLAWLAPHPDLPATRAELYAGALARMLNLPPGRLALAPPIVELQLLAAYGEPPSSEVPGLLEPSDDSAPRFAHPQIRRYMAARQLVDEGRYTPLQAVEQAERDEMALLIVTMIADPTPLYAALWGDGHLRAEDVLTLGRCLRERPPLNPAWILRVVGALALLVRNGPQAPRVHELLAAAMPALDMCLSGAAADDQAQRFLMRLFELLPATLATPRMERLVYADETPEPLAWELADMLIDRPSTEDHLPPPAPDRPALVRWGYIQAVRGPRGRQLLSAPLATTVLSALAASGAGDARRLRAAVALLDDPALPATTRVAALALLERSDHPAALGVIERAGHDPSAEVRQSALEALSRRDPSRAYTALNQAALDQTAPWDTRTQAILRLGDYLTLGAGALLEHCACDAALPLYVRMQAVTALGHQAAGMARLVIMAGDKRCHPEVRATAVQLLGAAGHRAALDDLLRLLADPATPTALAEAICDSLSILGDRTVRQPLLQVLDRSAANVGLTLAAVRALGRIGDQEVVEPLSQLLGPEALGRLQSAVDRHLLHQPAETSLDAPGLPQPIALRLAEVLAIGATSADRPTTLAELLMSEADHVRTAAARALVENGGPAAHAALLGALLDDATGGATAAIIAALAEVEGDTSAETLGYLLGAEEANSLTRWLVVQHLVNHPAGEAVMLRALTRTDIDTFTRGALAEALGQRGTFAAIAPLRQIADDSHAHEHLRSQALLALGLLDQPEIEPTLMHLIGNHAENVLLRGAAAESLPSQLSDEGRRFLRDMLRRERPPAPIAAGALRTLGRVHDREALPLLLRYCQDDIISVAQAAIAALAELGDANIAPLLVRIAQNPNADRSVRLEAIGTLLRIGGESYRPLLQVYIEHDPLPLQLQALEHLIATSTSPADLLVMLADSARPLPLRLRLLEHLRDNLLAAPVLLGILEDDDDEPSIRGLAAEALGRTRDAMAVPSLIRAAERAELAIGIRLHCIGALGAIGGLESWLALSRLADDETQPALQTRALQALRHSELSDK